MDSIMKLSVHDGSGTRAYMAKAKLSWVIVMKSQMHGWAFKPRLVCMGLVLVFFNLLKE